MRKSFALLCATSLSICGFADEESMTPKEVTLAAPALIEAEKKVEPEKKPVVTKPVVKAVFSAFTGKVKGEKVRMRLQPDLEGQIVRELHKNDLISIVGDEGHFWAVQPPEDVKAYVFRSFVLDNVVEGNRVNVRLQPDLEAPIIGHLNAGDRIKGSVCESNKKWLEIAPPTQAKFFIAKEFVEYAGGPDLKAQADKRKATVKQLMDSASLLSKAELQKPFNEIDFERVKHSFQIISQDYTDFSEYAEQAKEALAQAQEAYLQKRISYLESNSSLAKAPTEQKTIAESLLSSSDRMKMWEPIEEALHNAWARAHEEKTMEDYYEQQKLASVHLSGILEAFASPVKNKPGDYVLKDKNIPVAYLYSTKLDLHDFVGKKVSIVGSPRSNNNFAFPAYYVLDVE